MLQSQIKILCKAKITQISLQRLSHEQQQQAAKKRQNRLPSVASKSQG